MYRFLICNNAEKLREARPHVTVEAEYGDECVEGTILTLAHHGPRAHNAVPCLRRLEVGEKQALTDVARHEEFVKVGLSHLDLDALGGVLQVMDVCADGLLFWDAAAFVDINGPHRLPEHLGHTPREEEIRDQLWAFWAWSKEHKLFAPQDGGVGDCTEHVMNAVNVIQRILRGEPALIAAGREARRQEAWLDQQSYQVSIGQVLVRQSEEFCNHLYRHEDSVGTAVDAYNPKVGSITVSLAKPVDGISCRSIVQTLWGPMAGGQDGIAGSPRGKVMTFEQAVGAAEVLNHKLETVL